MFSPTRKNKLMRAVALLLAFVFILSSSSESEARRRRRHKRAKKRAVINEPDLYQRIGGNKMVSELVDEWVKAALADGRLNGVFGDVAAKPASVTKLRKDLTTEVCELSDGPCKSSDSKKLPDAFSIANEKFVVFADHLVRSMDKLKIREREKNELLGRIGEVRTDGPADEAESADDDESAEN